MLRNIFISTFVGLIAASSLAAEEVTEWKSVGDWDISIDHTLNHGCFINGSFEGGTFVRLGFNNDTQKVYIVLVNDKWSSLETGKEYPLDIKFGKKTDWEADARVSEFNDGEKFLTFTINADFVEEFMRQPNMAISYNGKRINNLTLSNSYAATMEMLNCQEQVDQYMTDNGEDPFADKASVSDDPFL